VTLPGDPPTQGDDVYPAELAAASVQFLTAAQPGIRVVARYRIDGGYTDALGWLRSSDARSCVIETKRGPVTVRFTDVVAAKQVPPPAERRSRP
jgi:hypothetical protein